MANKRIQCKVLLTLFLIINTCFAGYVMEGDSLLVRENAHIEKLLMLDVANEATEADSILVKATDNYICNFPILKLPFFTKTDLTNGTKSLDLKSLTVQDTVNADFGFFNDGVTFYNSPSAFSWRSVIDDSAHTEIKGGTGAWPLTFYHHSDSGEFEFYIGEETPWGLQVHIKNNKTLFSQDSVIINGAIKANNLCYLSDTSDLARKIHGHTISDVTGLQDALALKLDVTELDDYYTKTNLQTSGQASVHWGNVTNKPTVFPPEDHNHDTRYLKLTGGTLTGDVSFNASTEYANVTDLGYVAPIKIPNFRTTVDNMFVPFLHTSTYIQTGYRKHVSIGSYRTGTAWGGGIYFAQGGNDSYPTEHFLMEYGGNLKFINSSGTAYKFYNENFKPQWDDIGSKPSVFPPEDHNHDDRYLTGNPFNQDLNTTDRVKFDGVINQNAGVNSYHYRSVASKEIRPSTTGTMKITMPQSWSSTMLTIRISGYNYGSTTGWWECIVSGYNGISASTWYYPKCELRGNPPFSDVRLAHDGTKCCLLLGNTSTSWLSPNIHITDVITGYDNYSGWSTGWKIGLITDESGISNIATPDVDRPWHSGNLDPSDYALVSHNHDASDINSGTLSNDRLSFNPDYFVQGENSSRTITYGISNPFDGTNNVSTFFRLDMDEPSNPDGLEYYYGFRCVNPNDDGYTTEIAGRANAGKLWFGGLIGDVRQPWREIHHSGADYIKYDNNPPVIHSEFENIGFNSLTLNPTKGVYICGGSTTGQEITLGTTGVEDGQTVKILKASNLLAGVRYGEPNNYHWRSIGHYGAAEFIHYNGMWFCHGTEYIP